jgi:hypothetical protein
MKIKVTFFLLSMILVFASVSFAQYEWETVYNPRTNQNEERFNPWNEAQQRYERQQQANRERYDANMRKINKAWEDSEQRRQDLSSRMANLRMELNSRLTYGYAIIKAGKATTTYKSSPTFSLKNQLLQQAASPEIKQLVLQQTDISLKEFRDELRQNSIPQNDYADAKALVFIIAYEVYFGEKPSVAHLTFARKIAKTAYLKDAVFQSYNDLERQEKLESDEALVIFARMLKAKGDLGSVAQAKIIAKSILEKLWVNSVETILMTKTGFMHKGRKIIDDGKATHLFKYNPNQPIPESGILKNSQFRTQILGDYKQYLQQFYQVMEQKGGQKGDLAWCGTMVVLANFYVLTKQDWNAGQLKSSYDFVKNAMLKSPDIQAASGETKQYACESMAIQSVSNYANFLKGDLTTGSIAKMSLADFFKGLGEDANNYQWTANGIVKVK